MHQECDATSPPAGPIAVLQFYSTDLNSIIIKSVDLTAFEIMATTSVSLQSWTEQELSGHGKEKAAPAGRAPSLCENVKHVKGTHGFIRAVFPVSLKQHSAVVLMFLDYDKKWPHRNKYFLFPFLILWHV